MARIEIHNLIAKLKMLLTWWKKNYL